MNTYVFTSDSDNDEDSDSDSEDSIDVNQRADVYQPASHLRKAVNVMHGAKPSNTSSRVSGRQGSASGANPYSGQTRQKSTGKREN